MVVAKLAAIALLASSPFSLTLAPVKMAVKPGGHQHVLVLNSGKTLPANIEMQVHEIERNSKGICTISNLPVHWATTTPATFRLTPQARRMVQVVIARTGGKPGKHDLAIEATSVVKGNGNVRLHAVLISQALVAFPGHVAANAPKPCLTLVQPKTGGFPTVLLAGIILAALLLALAVVIILRHRRRLAT